MNYMLAIKEGITSQFNTIAVCNTGNWYFIKQLMIMHQSPCPSPEISPATYISLYHKTLALILVDLCNSNKILIWSNMNTVYLT